MVLVQQAEGMVWSCFLDLYTCTVQYVAYGSKLKQQCTRVATPWLRRLGLLTEVTLKPLRVVHVPAVEAPPVASVALHRRA